MVCNLERLGDFASRTLLFSLFFVLAVDSPGFAQTRREITSQNFIVHTDLPEDEANLLIERLEATLGRISHYWGRRPAQRIACYVAEDLDNWHDDDFPHGFARALIGGVGGGAFSESRPGAAPLLKVTVYSSARLGLVEHESVHAYCGQTFGATGPDWYKEGMAEMAFHGRSGRMEVECDRQVLKHLRDSPRKSIPQITGSGKMNEALSRSLTKLLSASSTDTVQQKNERLRRWHLDHSDSIAEARVSYGWCWSLCHFLSHNPNYQKRFRQLGHGYLVPRSKNFQYPHLYRKLFGSMQQEIDFEYQFFLDRIEVGYRVDLCRWDWEKEFRKLDPGKFQAVRVKAALGYQPSGLRVKQGGEYSFESSGTWRVEAEGSELDAEGNSQGVGRLEGVILSGYELSEPFDLGKSGSFKAPAEGRLYLRCRDRWNEIGDNRGFLHVRLVNRPLQEPNPPASKR